MLLEYKRTRSFGNVCSSIICLSFSAPVNCLDSVSWRVDYTLSSSELQQVNEPIVHLKLNVRNVDKGVLEPLAMTLSSDKFRVLLAGKTFYLPPADCKYPIHDVISCPVQFLPYDFFFPFRTEAGPSLDENS